LFIQLICVDDVALLEFASGLMAVASA